MARFSEAERVEVWDRWQAGDANRLIGRDLGRSAASIRAFCRVVGWGASWCPETFVSSPVVGGARGDLSRCRRGRLVSDGGDPYWSGAFDDQQGTGP